MLLSSHEKPKRNHLSWQKIVLTIIGVYERSDKLILTAMPQMKCANLRPREHILLIVCAKFHPSEIKYHSGPFCLSKLKIVADWNTFGFEYRRMNI